MPISNFTKRTVAPIGESGHLYYRNPEDNPYSILTVFGGVEGLGWVKFQLIGGTSLQCINGWGV